jgi:hypothetical protein
MQRSRTWLAAVLSLAAVPAFAQDEFLFFRTPSGNIHCMMAAGDYTAVRCDIAAFTPSFRDWPADCELAWGDAFEVGPGDRRGGLVCHGDTVISPDAAVLGYGGTLEKGGLTCRSEKAGLTCANRAGHGFFLSRARQEVF